MEITFLSLTILGCSLLALLCHALEAIAFKLDNKSKNKK